MGATRGTKRAREPRGYLVDAKKFGEDPATPWKPLDDDADEVDVVACYWQHLAICVLRDTYTVGLRQRLVEVLDVENLEHLDRQLSGAYRIRLKTLIEWAIALGDVSVLPQVDSIDGLFPPGARPGRRSPRA